MARPKLTDSCRVVVELEGLASVQLDERLPFSQKNRVDLKLAIGSDMGDVQRDLPRVLSALQITYSGGIEPYQTV